MLGSSNAAGKWRRRRRAEISGSARAGVVLAAALASFGTAGYDSTSLDDLAVGLGIRKPMILYHFVFTPGLLNAVLARVAHALTLSTSQALARAPRD